MTDAELVALREVLRRARGLMTHIKDLRTATDEAGAAVRRLRVAVNKAERLDASDGAGDCPDDGI